MCDDMDFDVSSDVSDSSFDTADDVSSNLDDIGTDFDDVGTEDFSFDDISDESFDIDDSILDIDDSADFDDSFEIDDISDDFDMDLSEEIETLDFEDDFDSVDEFETSEIDNNVSFDDEIETLELDDDIDTLELDASLDDVETLELDDSDFDIADELGATDEIEELSLETDSNYGLNNDSDSVETFDFDDSLDETEISELDDSDFGIADEIEFTDEIEELSLDENADYDLDDISDNVETLDVDEDFSEDAFEEVSDVIDESETDDIDIDISEDELLTEDMDASIDIDDETVDNDSYEAISNELNDSDFESDESTEEFNEYTDDNSETVEDVNDETLEQALRNDAVDNAPLIDAVYEDDSEFNDNSENEIPQMTDEEFAEFVDWENQHENGNYDIINDIMNDESLTDDQKEFMTQQLLDEIQEGENEVPEYGQRVKGLTYDGQDIITKPDEFEDNFEPNEQIDDIFNGELTESDINAVYEGLESYDFQGVDCFEDVERLDSSLESFTSENWEQLSLDEQKEKMTDLADYIIDVTGLENPPCIEFYSNPQEGDYGGFDRTTNTLSINEHMLYQNDEAADTIAHELWHALQYQRASNPRTKLDAMYAENFNDYISPQEDFEGYQSQILEAEARAFAQQIKDRLHSY